MMRKGRGMRLNLKDKIAERTETERSLMAAGAAPAPRIKSRIQRTALRWLAGFLVLMLVFTLVSRAASAVTTARVQADTAKSGVLTDRTVIGGKLVAEGDASIVLPAGLRIDDVYAEQGQRVQAGDRLLALDTQELESKLSLLRKDIEVTKLRIAAAQSGASGSNAEGIITAQQTLDDAVAAYNRLVEKQERAVQRSAEDYADAELALEDAIADYEKALQTTKANLIKAAEDVLKQAKENLESTQESADDAIRAAQQAVNQAAESQNASNDAYSNALYAYNNAAAALDSAKRTLANLEAAEEPDADAIAAAKEAVAAAQAAFDQAAANLNSQSSYGDGGYAAAKENLKIAKERWEKSVQKAKNAVTEAEAELEKAKARTDLEDEPVVSAAQSAVTAAENALKSAKRGQEDDEYSREEQLESAQAAIDTAQRGLDSAKRQAETENRNSAVSNMQSEIDRLTYQSELQALEKQLEVLEAAGTNDGIVVSPVSGTVLKTMEKGSKTADGADTVTLSRSDGGFTFEGSVDQKTAAKLAAGTDGIVTYTHEGKSVQKEVKISSIGAPNDDGTVTLTALMPDGSYPSGAGCELTVTRKSETYYSCLPLTALRSDGTGDHVLVLREKKTVMGTEWTVVKVPVTVIDRDSELMSIQSSLMWGDMVVASSNKPISEGDRVRLEGE